MSEEESNKQKIPIMQRFTTGNIFAIIGVIVGVITVYANMKSHMSDDNIHVDEKTEVVLSVDEYKDLIEYATTVKNEFPTIDANKERIIEIEKQAAVHEKEYINLYNEHDGLEGKVSRIYKELKEEIHKTNE